MDRYTRHQLKQDDFQNTIESVQIFVQEHLHKIILIAAATIIVAGAFWGWHTYTARQESAANAQLQNAITTFGAYVGTPPQNSMMPSEQTFTTAKAKYEQALHEFSAIVQQYPRTKAAGYARVHMAVCQAQLGNHDAAIQQLREAGRASDKDIAALSQFSLAGELAGTGKLDEAAKIYQNLADHPTNTVPRATALLSLADAYRTTQPKRSLEIYDQIQKEFGSDTIIAQVLKQQIESLPK